MKVSNTHCFYNTLPTVPGGISKHKCCPLLLFFIPVDKDLEICPGSVFFYVCKVEEEEN